MSTEVTARLVAAIIKLFASVALPANDKAASPRPKWWFAILWVAAFVAPIPLQQLLPLVWRERHVGLIIFVVVSAIGTGLLLKAHVPRPLTWVAHTVLVWVALAIAAIALLVNLTDVPAMFAGISMAAIAFAFSSPVSIPGAILLMAAVGVSGWLLGAIQSYAFVNQGEDWAASCRGRYWPHFSALTWLAMVFVPWLATGKVAFIGATNDLGGQAVAALSGGVISGAGMLWVLYRVPEGRDDGAAQTSS